MTHLGIIMDGNRRWATKNHLDPSEGHKSGYKKIEELINYIINNYSNIKFLTLYAFSSENLNKRSFREKVSIFRLFASAFKRLATDKSIHTNEVKINFLGRWYLLPNYVRKQINRLIKVTKDYNSLNVNICLVYDGQEEIIDAMKSIINSGIHMDNLSKNIIKSHMYSRDSPPVDLIIRTGMSDGQRISGFMLWDSSYSEFAFTKTLFPDFETKELNSMIKSYDKRSRRFGK